MKTFGVGKSLSTNDWQDYLLQMLQMGFIEIAYDQDNIVKITESGYDILYGRKRAELCVIDHSVKEAAKPKRRLHLEIPTITIPICQKRQVLRTSSFYRLCVIFAASVPKKKDFHLILFSATKYYTPLPLSNLSPWRLSVSYRV